MNVRWMEDAERVTATKVAAAKYVGECDNGDLWVWDDGHPYMSFIVPGRFVRLNRWNLRHRLMLRRSRLDGKVLMLAREATR